MWQGIRGHVRSNFVGYVALFFALGLGTAWAAGLERDSVKSKHVKDGQIKSVDVRDDGLTGDDVDEGTLDLPPGPTGPRGPVGPEGPAGSAALNIVRFNGDVPSIAEAPTNGWVFAGPTANVTVGQNRRLTGSASAVLGIEVGQPTQLIGVGLCHRRVGTTEVVNFAGTAAATHVPLRGAGPEPVSASASSGFLQANTYTVGLCVRQTTEVKINNNFEMNGWVMVTD
jgi:hypothetical protein